MVHRFEYADSAKSKLCKYSEAPANSETKFYVFCGAS